MSEQTIPEAIPIDPPSPNERYAILWRTGEQTGAAMSTYLLEGRVLLFSGDSEEVRGAKRVELFEDAGDILKDRNGRKVAVPRSVAEIINPSWTFVDAP